MSELTKLSAWNGKYRGIPYEINNFNIGSGNAFRNIDAWTFYIFFREEQFPKDFDRIWINDRESTISKHYFYDYNDTFIGNLNWHGGCTYYKKVAGFDHEQRVIKAGCDYQHYFDEGRTYTVEIVEWDVKECIDSLYDLGLEILQWCSYCGDYVDKVDFNERCKECENR